MITGTADDDDEAGDILEEVSISAAASGSNLIPSAEAAKSPSRKLRTDRTADSRRYHTAGAIEDIKVTINWSGSPPAAEYALALARQF